LASFYKKGGAKAFHPSKAASSSREGEKKSTPFPAGLKTGEFWGKGRKREGRVVSTERPTRRKKEAFRFEPHSGKAVREKKYQWPTYYSYFLPRKRKERGKKNRDLLCFNAEKRRGHAKGSLPLPKT